MHGDQEYLQREETRRRRTAMLLEWVQADLAEQNESLSGALLKWREELMQRLTNRRPILIRIPRIFVEHLGLSSQKVLITESHEVLSVQSSNGRNARNAQTGRVIVPPQV